MKNVDLAAIAARYQRILVPLDGSRKAEWALPPAVAIARATDARISLLHVEIPVPVMAIGLGLVEARSHPATDHAAMPEYLRDVADRIAAAGLSATTYGVVASSGTAISALGTEIAERADITHTDMIVMTTHARATIPRFFLGSVAHDVVRTSTAPVLLIKPGDEPVTSLTSTLDFGHVLIPLDGSVFSEEVVPDAVALGELCSAHYTLLTIVEPPRPFGIPMEAAPVPTDNGRLGGKVRAAHMRLDRAAERLLRRSLRVSTQVIVDNAPSDRITYVAREIGAGLVAMTTHARGGFGSLMLGSVASEVIRGAPVPVLLYRPRHG